MSTVVHEIAPLQWDDATANLIAANPVPSDASLSEIIGHGIDTADYSGFVWLPHALGAISTGLHRESETLDFWQGDSGQGKLLTGYVTSRDDRPTFESFKTAIKEAFRQRGISDRVSLSVNDYPDTSDYMTTHMDQGSMPSPVVLAVVGGIRQSNFHVYRSTALGVHELTTGTGDLIVQATPNWGSATGLFHGVLRGPRRSVVGIGLSPVRQ